MELYYFCSASGNFGDDLNQWLWDELLPGWRDVRPGHMLVGVGTLINGTLPKGMPKLVLGSGQGYGDIPDPQLMSECDFVAVRGPRSASILGLPQARAIVDPAVMIATLPEFAGIAKSDRPVFMPHHETVHRLDWAALCQKAGIEYVSPQGESRQVIRKLAAAPLVITESMHGAILADAFGTPWKAVSISHRFNAEKWRDWADSLGLKLEVAKFSPLIDRVSGRASDRKGGDARRVRENPGPSSQPPKLRYRIRIALDRLTAVARFRTLMREPGQLSDRKNLAAAQQRYREMLEEVRRSF